MLILLATAGYASVVIIKNDNIEVKPDNKSISRTPSGPNIINVNGSSITKKPLINLPDFIVNSIPSRNKDIPSQRKPAVAVNRTHSAPEIQSSQNKIKSEQQNKPSIVVVGSADSNNKPRPQSSKKSSANTTTSYRRPSGKVEQRVLDRLQTEDRVRVIVNLNDKDMQDFVLNQLNSFEKAVDMKQGFAGYVDAADLAALENSPVVDFIYEDRKLAIANAQSFPQINADKAANVSFNDFADLTGAGQTVCIIDTGVDYYHDDLGNCTYTQFINGNCPKVIGGWDFYGSGDNDPIDSNGHGTSIAGLIAGNGSNYTGLAPDAKIVALKVTDSSGNGWASNISFAPDEFEYRFAARDSFNNESQVSGTVRKYADEPREDEELPSKFPAYSEVLDYGVNDPKGIDIGGSMIYPDWWSLIENPSFPGDPDYGYFVVGWYQGAGDDDHAAEKALCESYFVPWAQINECPQDEIGPKLDEIRAAGWVSGQVKSKSLEKTVEEVF